MGQETELKQPIDFLTINRQELIDAHVIHEFDSSLVTDNHCGCYGALITQRYQEILSLLKGRKIIDCGCGFGTFAKVAREAGFTVHPVDIDEVSIDLAKELNQVEVIKESIYQTSLGDNTVEVAVCFDSIQHFNLEELIAEFKRIGIQQVLIYDSNIHNLLLQLYRRKNHHEESHELSPKEIISIFQKNGFQLTLKKYENLISLPASGGYQQRGWPIINKYPKVIEKLDTILLKLMRLCGLTKWLSFRFLLIFETSK
jgi:SAM-dependent methyltransferase